MTEARQTSPSPRMWAGWRWLSMAGGLASAVLTVGLWQNTERAAQREHALLAQLQAQPKVSHVAVLGNAQAAATVLATFDEANQKLVLKRVNDAYQAPQDKSLQLWSVTPGQIPVSLGVMSDETLQRWAVAMDRIANTPVLAISLEPKGGVSGENGPTGPVLFTGAVLRSDI